ncbi:MAG TPA: PASTA domain-containing protein [Solirubrobacteraceae bacterium]|nr:PASTA domain-containing protein [Solirubrobacteraceae bacterium]
MQRLERDTLVDGRYKIVRKLGSGGMADVYCAEDQQLGRRVALKVLHQRFAEDAQFVERFRREASSAAGLQHPNIVGIFDRGEWDGTYYIAMEFVEGRTLKDIVLEKGPAPPDAAVDITLQILRAARFAHKRGVVHRDIKPHNVLIDTDGRVRVADFGIARAGTSDMTETGSIMGTAQYLSPEQAQGRPVDARSDLYSIGVVLYELITGRVPFDADSPVTVALMQVNEPPPPPRSIVPEIPASLEAIVLRALEKDPARRFADADEFIAALEGGRMAPVEVVPPIEEILEEDDRRGRRWWLWLLILLAVAAIAVGLYLTLRPEQLTVPNVVGRESSTATQILQNRGFEVEIENVVNPDVERDTVAAQDPRPDTTADEGSTVTITVSTGPGEASVPSVAGLPQDEAEAQLQDAGFESRVEREFSDDVRQGRVIATQPGPGSVIERGTEVTLQVSRGPEQIEVPDVVGEAEDDARDALQDAGLSVGEVTEEESSDEEPGTVLEQDPAAGAAVDRGDNVNLVIAAAPPDVEVPEVLGFTEEDATTDLEAAGFEVRVRDQEVTDPAQEGLVQDQAPDAGEERPEGSTIRIAIGRLAEPTPSPSPTTEPVP